MKYTFLQSLGIMFTVYKGGVLCSYEQDFEIYTCRKNISDYKVLHDLKIILDHFRVLFYNLIMLLLCAIHTWLYIYNKSIKLRVNFNCTTGVW